MRFKTVPGCHWRGLRGCTALASAAALTAMTAVLAAGGPPAQAALSSHGPGAITPGTISMDSELQSVSAVSPTDAWAVGYYNSTSVDEYQPLIEHWNGKTWTKVNSPAPSPTHTTELNAVSAISATDVWAAGYYGTSGDGPNKTFLEHWNGKTWARVKSPSPSTRGAGWGLWLQGVSAVSSTDAWAVGEYNNSTGQGQLPLIEHWNGKTWAKLKSPDPAPNSSLNLEGVSAVSATDAWAAGFYVNSSSVYEPLIEHWNGTTWKQVTVPNPRGSLSTILTGVTAVSSADVWAVGYYYLSEAVQEPVIEHWNGKTWTQVKSPSPKGAEWAWLRGVSADSTADAWAAGYYDNSGGVTVPLILHWNGKIWAKVKSPTPSGAVATYPVGVSADSATNAWAAGDYEISGGVHETLTLHWNGTAWKVVKSPNGA